MPAKSWGTTPENVIPLRGVSTAEALNIRSVAAHIPHLLSVKVIGDKDKGKDRDSNPSNPIRTGVGRRPTLTSRTGHLNRLRLDLSTNCLETTGAGST